MASDSKAITSDATAAAPATADSASHGEPHPPDTRIGRCPAPAQYGYYTVRGLEPGKLMKWCTCGLSKNQPWCDSSHKGTGFRSFKWTVPEKPQTMYSICGCKHTKNPPFCDGTHNNLPEELEKKQEECLDKSVHPECCKMCTKCGWVPDF